MSATGRVQFASLPTCDLIVDTVYESGTANHQGDDPINKLLGVGNAGGFRVKGSPTKRTVLYGALYTSGVDPDWPDVLDPRTGTFIYHGDQKTPGRELHDTPRKGNLLLRDLFELAQYDAASRAAVPPLFLFEKASPGRSVTFRGLLAPGGPGIRPDERLVALWKNRAGERFQNYRATFTVLDAGTLSRKWIDDLKAGITLTGNTPPAWRRWVATGTYDALVAPGVMKYRTPEEQLPRDPEGVLALAAIRSYFESDPTRFEHCAARLWQMMAPNATDIVVTQKSRDGGRDAIGTYALGPVGDRVELTFSLEAKCYAPTNSVGVHDVSRLIGRIRHRQFGVLVTTSYLGRQAYQEIRDDGHPVIVIAGRDILDILRARGIGTVHEIEQWLHGEFPRNKTDGS